MWLSWLRTLTRMLVQSLASLSGVKDPVLPQAAVQVVDVAQIQCCCGSGVGLAAVPIRLPHAASVTIKKKKIVILFPWNIYPKVELLIHIIVPFLIF